MVYSVPQSLNMLRLAKRSQATIMEYQNELGYFSKFLKVPLDELHKHLLPENLINYAATRIGKSEAVTTVQIGIISRYYKINGVKFDEMELNVLKARSIEEQNDKPLELKTLQKMMDFGDIHAKAIISRR